MTLYEFRQKLVRELEATANQHAQDNGASLARELGEYRVHAGMVAGLRMAAGIAEDFLKRDEDDNDG